MAAPANQAPTRREARQNALADIQFASVIDPDLTPSEDETLDEKEFQLETLQSAIGVSIGQQQTHLISPKTPAAEKAAALEDTEGGAFFEGWQQGQDGTLEQSTQSGLVDDHSDDAVSPTREPARKSQPEPDHHGSSVRLPSPWRAGPKTFKRLDEQEHRTALRETLNAAPRRRAMSGGSATEALKKYIPFNLLSMPKTSSFLNFTLPSFSVSSSDSTRGRSPATLQRKKIAPGHSSSPFGRIPQHDGSEVSSPVEGRRRPRRSQSQPRHSSTDPIPQRQFAPVTPSSEQPAQNLASIEAHRRPPSRIRRSNSEGSLLLYRSRSFASSLGDDSRFENVSEQVNSRLKALKDSWQDANFTFPKLRPLPNFNLGSREDVSKTRYGTFNSSRNVTENSTSSNSNQRVSFMAYSSSSKLPQANQSPSSIAGMSGSAAATHPHFMKAMTELTGDLVVLGGYRGSVLRSAEPPHRQLWVPLKVGLNLRKVDLELGLNPEDEETEEQRIIPDGMLTHIGPVDIAKRLLKRLRSSENARNGSLRVHNYGYDWRLSPHILSRRFIEFLKTLPCNQPGVPKEKRGAFIIAHSLGGLLTRHAINQCPELVAGVVYAGVPQHCVNILGPLRNGDDVLLSSRVLTAQVNFTIRTSYALLPLDGKCFFNKKTKEEYPIDFFDINTWKEYRLSPCIATPLPHPHANAPPPLTTVSGILNAMSQALPSLPGRKSSLSNGSNTQGNTPGSTTTAPTTPTTSFTSNLASSAAEESAQASGFAPQMSHDPGHDPSNPQSSPATTVTLPRDASIAYLSRTLASIKSFKQDLAHRPEHTAANAYPPIALIYGKSTPTVYGAKVDSREAIKRADAYDELAFASGDGVVLARAAMVPAGYSVVKGGVVSSDRGHVTLLGDLEAVGRCLSALVWARARGVGLGGDETAHLEKQKGDGEVDV